MFQTIQRRMRLKLPNLLVLLLAASTAIWLIFKPAPAQSQISQINTDPVPVSYELLAELTSNSPIQLRLPQVIIPRLPPTVGQYYGTGRLSYTPRQELSGYQVFIQADPQRCLQALACTEAYADATAIDRNSPTIEQQYAMFHDARELAKYRAYAGHLAYSISLSNGQQVTILPWTHGGAGAGYEKAVWDEWSDNGARYRYVIGLKMGSADALIQMLETIFSERTSNGWGRFNWNDLVQPTDPTLR